MSHLLKVEPVRIYMIVVAALMLVAFYVPSLPVTLIAALFAAILGVGEGVRHAVTPNERVGLTVGELDELGTWEYRG